MANILISNLNPTGSDLFTDPESYMTDISDSELGQINGGMSITPIAYALARLSQQLIFC